MAGRQLHQLMVEFIIVVLAFKMGPALQISWVFNCELTVSMRGVVIMSLWGENRISLWIALQNTMVAMELLREIS